MNFASTAPASVFNITACRLWQARDKKSDYQDLVQALCYIAGPVGPEDQYEIPDMFEFCKVLLRTNFLWSLEENFDSGSRVRNVFLEDTASTGKAHFSPTVHTCAAALKLVAISKFSTEHMTGPQTLDHMTCTSHDLHNILHINVSRCTRVNTVNIYGS